MRKTGMQLQGRCFRGIAIAFRIDDHEFIGVGASTEAIRALWKKLQVVENLHEGKLRRVAIVETEKL